MENTLVIIDGNSLIFRAFYALPPMNTPDGTPTNAVFGFFSMLFNLIDKYAPDHIGVAFDKKGGTFRHEMFDGYKAGRRETPDTLLEQFPLLKNALQKLGIATLELQGFEADDILGVMSKKAAASGMRSYIVTGDKDALQLITDSAHVLLTKKGVSDIEEFDEAHLKEVYGIEPPQIVDMKSLMGDHSDNIPGIPGVGEKTALKLLAQYGTLDKIYDSVAEMPKNKLREKIENNKDSAYLSHTLATIKCDAPVSEDLDDLGFGGLDDGALYSVLEELGFYSVIKRLGLDKKEEPAAEAAAISTEGELAAVVEKCRKSGAAAILLDEDALYIAPSAEGEYKASFKRSFLEEGIGMENALKAIGAVTGDSSVKKICHGAKNLRHGLADCGAALEGDIWDIMLAAYVADPTRRDFSFAKTAQQWGASGHASAMFKIAENQKKQIENDGLSRIFYDIETPLERVLFNMENEGFRLDRDALLALQVKYDASIKTLEREITDLAGEEFNIASTKQLGHILFEKLELPVQKKTKTGYSTDIEVLEKLEDRHEIIPKIIEWRQVTKLKSTYIDGLLTMMNKETGKIHTTFNQAATATGRISSAEPNLQNIPIRRDISHEIREAFIPSKEGNLIVSADYSQIELRVLAHIADDEHLKDAFLKDQDIHTRTASEVFGVPMDEVTREMRSSAKAVNFGIVYGISDFGLARNLGIPIYMAGEYIKRYLEEFSGVRSYMERIVKEAKRDGYVTTLFGRRRYISELKSPNYNTRSFGERAALNTPIQGTAADIIKVAMVNVAKALDEGGYKSRLILQVHDELIVDAEPDEAERVGELLSRVMSGAAELSVKLKVNVAMGKTWSEAK